MPKFTITAGHSNNDCGAYANGFKEAELVTEFRNIVAMKLSEKGHAVVTDGTGTTNLPLVTAAKLVKVSDLGVEFHFNAAVNKTAAGVEVIGLTDKTGICQKLATAIAGVLDIPVRGNKGGYKHPRDTPHKTLGFCSAGGVIVEICFISNPTEMAAYQAKKWLVASAVVDVLDKWSQK